MGDTLEETLHGPLEDGRCCGYAKWKSVIVEESPGGVDGRQFSGVIVQHELLIRVSQVQLVNVSPSERVANKSSTRGSG